MENPYLGMLWSGLERTASWLPYFIGILAFIFALNFMDAKFGGKRRGRWRGGRSRWRKGSLNVSAYKPRHDALPPRITDAADQLRTVMRADFTAQRLLNKSEARLFRETDKIVLEMRPGWQVMAQVSLGEILRCKDAEAYRCINSKRVDLLIVDDECRAVGAIEYQGGGHHQGTAAARDAVKKEALRRAGIGYVEVNAGDTPAELRRLIERLLKPPPD